MTPELDSAEFRALALARGGDDSASMSRNRSLIELWRASEDARKR